jgi:hypothetical protein
MVVSRAKELEVDVVANEATARWAEILEAAEALVAVAWEKATAAAARSCSTSMPCICTSGNAEKGPKNTPLDTARRWYPPRMRSSIARAALAMAEELAMEELQVAVVMWVVHPLAEPEAVVEEVAVVAAACISHMLYICARS